MTETVTLLPAGKPVRLDFGEAYIRPGVGVHWLHIELKTHGVWLDPDPAGDGASLLLEGQVWLDAAMKPVAAIAPQVLTLRGFPCSGEHVAILLTDDQPSTPQRRPGGAGATARQETAMCAGERDRTVGGVDEIGPVAWRNWRAAQHVPPVRSGVEVLLCSDAQVTGEVTTGLGPYQLLNALPRPGTRGAPPAIVIRAGYAIEFRPDLRGSEDVTDESRYHGGDMFDEIAALLSLGLGIRCRSAGRIRIWELSDADGDPLGHPVHFDVDPPYLPDGNDSIPRLRRPVALTDATALLQRYAAVGANDAVTLLRAARLYQQAVWSADADPSQSWVQLISALETAAGASRAKAPSLRDRLRLAWPELAELLDDLGDEEQADAIARVIAPVVKSKVAFLRFMKTYCPPPPAERPYEWAQVDWSRLPEHLAALYGYRSRALHAGTPFPVPMCEPARTLVDGVPIERPMGISTWAHDARWNNDDTPMLLSTFEHITRGALLAWWSQLPLDAEVPIPTRQAQPTSPTTSRL